MSVTRVGLVGAGVMGRPMARNLRKAGFPVTAYNRTAASVQALAGDGVVAAASPSAVAAASDVVITMVSDSPDVVAVATGPSGVFAGAAPGTVIVDMSTISPAVTRDLAAQAKTHGCTWLDAPVSGGEAGAIAGTLTIMVGGDADAFAKAKPVLEAMGSRVTHMGPSGHGQTTKLCNQILVAINLLGASEALVFGAKAGLDLDKLHTALTGGAANSWALDKLGRKMLDGDFAPAFKVKLQQKDLRLVAEAARELQTPIIGTSLVEQLLRVLEGQGRGDDGTQALVNVLEDMAGAKARV
jgi:3-hydroxyisobutyrate dehydrogenase